MVPAERALATAVVWTVPAVAVSALALLVPLSSSSASLLAAQLALVAAWNWLLALRLISDTRAHGIWFAGRNGRWAALATSVGIVALCAFAAMLVALASSAALRLDPSAQFLQLISAADIAWVVSGLMVGLSYRHGRPVWAPAGFALAVVCVWASYRYLAVVGLGPNGAWVVSGEDLLRLVIPFDVLAAVMAVAAIAYGVRSVPSADQETAQASDQL